MAYLLFAFSILLIVFELIVYWLHRKKDFIIAWKLGLISLSLHVLCMWLFLAYLEEAVPDGIQPWILNIDSVLMNNIALLMPGAFLSLYLVTKYFFSQVKKSKRGWLALFIVIAMPLIWYILVSIIQPLWLGQYVVIVGIIIASLIVLFFLGGIIYLFDSAIYNTALSKNSEQHYIIAVLLGFAAPLGGLALNFKIPFPADFQLTSVYVLTILNGLVLLIKPGGNRYTGIRLLLRSLTLPFILWEPLLIR